MPKRSLMLMTPLMSSVAALSITMRGERSMLELTGPPGGEYDGGGAEGGSNILINAACEGGIARDSL